MLLAAFFTDADSAASFRRHFANESRERILLEKIKTVIVRMKSEKGALEFKEKGLEESNTLINPDMKVTELGDGYTLVGCGYSNRTPWNSPRECGEEELKTKLDRLMSQVSDPSRCILAAHVPPYESGLDDAPKLKDMQVQSSGGQVEMAPAGSTAVREIIEKYQPLLGLHGHIHEAHATTKIGNTVCVNPGSDYGDGVLHGCILTVSKGRVKTDQLVSG